VNGYVAIGYAERLAQNVTLVYVLLPRMSTRDRDLVLRTLSRLAAQHVTPLASSALSAFATVISGSGT
jgi:hypothetical protein